MIQVACEYVSCTGVAFSPEGALFPADIPSNRIRDAAGPACLIATVQKSLHGEQVRPSRRPPTRLPNSRSETEILFFQRIMSTHKFQNPLIDGVIQQVRRMPPPRGGRLAIRKIQLKIRCLSFISVKCSYFPTPFYYLPYTGRMSNTNEQHGPWTAFSPAFCEKGFSRHRFHGNDDSRPWTMAP